MQTKSVQYKLKKINGDVLTPITVFLRLQGVKKFLYESSLKHNEQGRYSFIGVNPLMELIGKGDRTTVTSQTEERNQESGLPLQVLERMLPKLNSMCRFLFMVGQLVLSDMMPFVNTRRLVRN